MTEFLNMLNQNNYLVLDTETTGLQRGEVCQIAIIDAAGVVLLDTLVKTKEPIPADASRIHGITDAMVVDAPTWPELVPTVKDLLQDRDLVVYNATYDRKIMHQTAERWGMGKIDWKTIARWWCAMEEYAAFHGEWNDYYGNYRWQRLTTAAQQCQVPVSDAHSAVGDCIMTLGVLKAMQKALSKT